MPSTYPPHIKALFSRIFLKMVSQVKKHKYQLHSASSFETFGTTPTITLLAASDGAVPNGVHTNQLHTVAP